MLLRHENCGDKCKNPQNITFCVDQSSREISPIYANEQTIDMIKILIGKNRLFSKISKKNHFSKKIAILGKKAGSIFDEAT